MVKVEINPHGNEMPVAFDEWADLVTAKATVLRPYEYKRIPLGISVSLPEGFEAFVIARASTYEKWGVIMAPSPMVYKHSYSGDQDFWYFPAIALRETYIPAGSRICQFRIFPCAETMELIKVDSTGNPDRGGWGSTG